MYGGEIIQSLSFFFSWKTFFSFVCVDNYGAIHKLVDCAPPPQKWLSNFHHNTHTHTFFQQYSLWLLYIEIINYESSPNCAYINVYYCEFNFTRASRVSSSPNSRIIKIRVLWNLCSWREMIISSLFVDFFFIGEPVRIG